MLEDVRRSIIGLYLFKNWKHLYQFYMHVEQLDTKALKIWSENQIDQRLCKITSLHLCHMFGIVLLKFVESTGNQDHTFQ